MDKRKYKYTSLIDGRMVVYGILGETKNRPVVYAKDKDDEIVFNFDPYAFSPNKEKVLRATNALMMTGNITGARLTGITFGDVRVYMNPIICSTRTYELVIEVMAKAIGDPEMDEYEAIEV